MFDDTYKTIAKKAEGLFRDKGSRFIGFAYPVRSELEVKEIMTGLKKEYFDATHHCYAYYIGHIGTPATRMNDDGEPSGTAGRPIYGQIVSSELKNILIVVIRYFGGTKLGVSGLIHAYKETAKITIENAEIIENTIRNIYSIGFDYPLMNTVMQVLKNDAVTIKDNGYSDDKALITFEVTRSYSQEITTQLDKIFGVSQKFLGII